MRQLMFGVTIAVMASLGLGCGSDEELLFLRPIQQLASMRANTKASITLELNRRVTVETFVEIDNPYPNNFSFSPSPVKFIVGDPISKKVEVTALNASNGQKLEVTFNLVGYESSQKWGTKIE